jgi:hypothetical protein
MGLITQAALALTLGAASLGWEVRYAVRYDAGLFERVAARRHLAPAPCMAAHPTVPLGAWLLVEGREGVRLRCKVVDTSEAADRALHMAMRIIEVDPASGAQLCGVGWQGNASECPVKVTSVP